MKFGCSQAQPVRGLFRWSEGQHMARSGFERTPAAEARGPPAANQTVA